MLVLRLLLAPLLGRARTYARVIDHLVSIRNDPPTHERTCRLLLKRWNLNWENGSRDSCLVDYEYLVSLLTHLNSSMQTESAARAMRLVDALVAIIEDDRNFRVDGRMMKWDAARQAAAKFDELRGCLLVLSLDRK